ncbi:hypothetical protein J7E43_01800 [Bacillus sp. ISL-8]|uniref:Uncharacterized protein n=2 Tax=Bacillus cereus group TaxID=86661 RepID=R8CMH3_BACCE|nr:MULTISPECIES: hypothetical protein [Bacillus cereus group]ARJ25572.1 hypothetical protein B7492_31540 [Bacillus mycoides]EOO12828.1 hypothetical protein IGA_04842 [Bacillus cereus HuA3-9]MBT2576181.1 hypothetical protein [Bacillus sp. ISL-8]
MNQKEISIMYDRSFTYVGKLKKKWESEEKWKGPTDMREIKKILGFFLAFNVISFYYDLNMKRMSIKKICI